MRLLRTRLELENTSQYFGDLYNLEVRFVVGIRVCFVLVIMSFRIVLFILFMVVFKYLRLDTMFNMLEGEIIKGF